MADLTPINPSDLSFKKIDGTYQLLTSKGDELFRGNISDLAVFLKIDEDTLKARFIEKSTLGAPMGTATLNSNGELSEDQRWKVTVDFTTESTPIWLNTPAPTKAGVFYPSEAGTYINYGGISITQSELDSNIVRIQFDGVNRFQKMVIGLNGQFLPLSGGEMQNAIVMNTRAGGDLLKGNGTGSRSTKLLYFEYNDTDGFCLDIAIPDVNIATEKKIRLTESGWLLWNGAISLRTVGGTLISIPNLLSDTRAYIVGSGGAGDNAIQLHKLAYNQYAIGAYAFNGELITTPNGDSRQWNLQSENRISKYSLTVSFEDQTTSIAKVFIGEVGNIEGSIEVTITGGSTYTQTGGRISKTFSFIKFNDSLIFSEGYTNCVYGRTRYFLVLSELKIENGKLYFEMKRRASSGMIFHVRFDWIKNAISNNVIPPTFQILNVASNAIEIESVVFPHSPQVPNPTLPQDAVNKKWVEDNFAVKNQLAIIDGQIAQINTDVSTIRSSNNNTVLLVNNLDTKVVSNDIRVDQVEFGLQSQTQDLANFKTEVPQTFLNKTTNVAQSINSPINFGNLAKFESIQVPNSRNLDHAVNNRVLETRIAEIPSGGGAVEILVVVGQVEPAEERKVDLTEYAIKRVPSASYLYENERGLICLGDLNLALKKGHFDYEIEMGNEPKFVFRNITIEMNQFTFYR